MSESDPPLPKKEPLTDPEAADKDAEAQREYAEEQQRLEPLRKEVATLKQQLDALKNGTTIPGVPITDIGELEGRIENFERFIAEREAFVRNKGN